MSRNSLLQSILANPSLLPTENPPGMDQSPVTQGARGKIVDMLGNVIMNNSVAPRYRQWAIQSMNELTAIGPIYAGASRRRPRGN